MRAYRLAWLLVAVLAVPAFADTVYDVQLNTAKFSSVNSGDVPDCAPSAVANGLQWLVNTGGARYAKLLPNGPGTAADDLAAKMQTGPQGTSTANMVSGTKSYLDDHAKNTTTVSGQSSDYDGTDPNVKKAAPDAGFLYGALQKNAAVIIGVQYTQDGKTAGHALTLTSFHWKDDGNGQIDKAEGATIDFIDPATQLPGAGAPTVDTKKIWQETKGGPILTDWQTDAKITTAMALSPVPCPPALWGGLALLGAILLASLGRPLVASVARVR